MDWTRFDYDAAAFEALGPDQRRAAIRAMASMAGDVQRNPLWTFDPLDPRGTGVPHLPQHRFLLNHRTEDGRPVKFRLLPGGNRGGKTTTGSVSVIVDICDREVIPPHLQAYKRWDAPIDAWIIAPSARLVEKIHLPIWRKWCPKDQLVGGSVDKAFSKEYQTLHFKNGSTVSFLTQGMDVEVFQGVPLHIVYFDEEPLYDHGLEIFTECMQRLVDFNGDVRMTFTPLNGMCVDEETECLTKRGWKRHHELSPGDVILTYNEPEGATEWAPLRAIYRNPDAEVVSADGRLDAVFTPDHKWVTPRGLVPWEDMKTTDRAIVASPHLNTNIDCEDKAILELAGWVLSDGSTLANDNKVIIYQSVTRYPENCAHIADLIERAGAQHHVSDRPYRGTGMNRRFVITGDVARSLRRIVGHPKRLRPEFVAGLDAGGVEALMAGLLGGDGHLKANGTWEFTTTNPDLRDSVSMLGVLWGKRVTTAWYATSQGKDAWKVRLRAPKLMAGIPASPAGRAAVWCPNTRNGTFVARRGDSVFVTGNTWVYDKLWLPWAQQQPEKEAAIHGFAAVEWGGFTFPIYTHLVAQDDNPVIDAEGKAAAMAMARNDEERQARSTGRFVSFAGKIYDGFNPAKHIVPDDVAEDRMRASGKLITIGALDPGFRHMAGVLWLTLDDDGVWVWPELPLEQTIIPQVVAEIQLAEATFKIPRVPFLADPAIAKVDAQTGLTDQQAYARAGLATRAANNDVRAGINAIRSLIAGDRLHVAAGCEVLIDQINRYRWRKQGRSEDAAPERPVKRDDHLVDALRYGVMALPIPEARPPVDTRSTRQRAMAADFQRAVRAAQQPVGPVGPGQFA